MQLPTCTSERGVHSFSRSQVNSSSIMYSLVRTSQGNHDAGQLPSMFTKKSVCFVTGASQGLGESIALNFGSKFPKGSLIILLARNEEKLTAVKKRLLEKSPDNKVVVHRFDQSSQDQQVFEASVSQTLESVGAKATDFEQAVLVNNAGSIGSVVYTRNLPNVSEVAQNLNTNIAGVISLTTQFIKAFPASSGVGRVVVNVSSLAAVQPFKSWAMYCTGKAARDMFFKVLAAEEEDIRVLNYAPGPLQTEMTDIVETSEDEAVRNWAKNAKAQKELLTCDASVAKLIEVLEKNSFESGAHSDYYDDI